MEFLYTLYLAISRWVLPLLSLLLVALWIGCFRQSRPPRKVIARFISRDGIPHPVVVAEGVLGRRRCCDVVVKGETIEKRHAMFYQKGEEWFLAPLQGETWLNEEYLEEPAPLLNGDVVALCEQELIFECNRTELEDITSFTPPSGAGMMAVLTLFQVILGGQLCLRYLTDLNPMIPLCFGVLAVGGWVYFLVHRLVRPAPLLAEVPILYLLTLGTAVCACAAPDVLLKQLVCTLLGAAGCVILTLLLKYPTLCQRLRYGFAFLAVGVMAFTVVFGTRINGSRNWLSVGGYSFQPSEFAKVALLLVGSCCLYVTLQKVWNRLFFFGFSAVLMGCLVLMVDFGAIAIFFVTTLVLLLMQLTDWRLVVLLLVGAVGVGTVVLMLYPHIADRFSVWTNVWQYASSTGYQQTRTLIAAASGGLLGLGGGNGTLRGVAAADTDLVFGVLCEEWGSIIALCAALCFVALGVYARRLAAYTASSFYATAVCGAATMMLFQTALNLFGSTDILPLTGVTMMFVSRGGTSLVASFLLLAFFKAAERTPAPLETERRRYY